MSVRTACRRRHPRIQVGPGDEARVEFGWPGPTGHPCSMEIRDISAGGVSFRLAHDLPGLEVGDSIRRVRLTVRGREILCDLLVMHLTPDNTKGSVCGAFIYPRDDEDILGLQQLVAELTTERTRSRED